MAPETERSLKVVAVCLMGLGVLVFLGSLLRSLMVRSPTPDTRRPELTYNPRAICPNAFNEDLDFSKKYARYVDIPLHEGCFGGFVHIPGSWRNWEEQPTPGTDQDGFWFAIWIANEANSRGPFGISSNPNLTYNVARFQGHGTLRLYTNVDAPVPTNSESVATPEPQLPEISQLSIHHTDPHICEKPADAYYTETGDRFQAGSHSDGVPPEFLFDSNHFDGKITWANGFKGKVPVCILIDVKGNPLKVDFPQPPGPELQDHIKGIIMGWHFKGGFIPNFWDPPTPVPCQMAEMFTFE